MTDLATLGIAVDSREVVDASKDLDRIREAAARAEKAADSFGARTEAAGRRAAAANDNSAATATRATRAYEGYRRAALLAARAIGAIAGAAIGTALIRYGDAWSDMQSRVGAAIKDMDAAPAVMKRIVDIANASYSPLAQTAEVYSRNMATLRDYGRGAMEAADFTEALNHALVITATKGQDADVVINAYSRAISNGKLRTMEFETIMSRSPRLLEAVADHLGTNVTGLRAMAAAGKVTGEALIQGPIKSLELLRKQAAEMPATVSDAFQRIQTNLMAFVGQMDKSVGASETFAAVLIILADNIARVVTYGATAVTMFGTYYVAAIVFAYAKTVTLVGALTLLRAALIRTGIGALIVGAGELVYQFGRLVEATGSWTGALQEMGNRSRILLDAVVWAFRAAAETIQMIWFGAMADILRATEESFGGILRILGVSTGEMSGAIGRMEKSAENMGEIAKSSAIIAAEQFKAAFADIKLPDQPGLPGGGSRAPAIGEIDKAATKAANAYKKIVEGAREFIATQELERQALGMTEQEASRLRYTQDLLNQAKQAGITLTAAQTAELTGLASQMAAAEQATKAAKMTQDAYNEAAQSMGGWLMGLTDKTKDFGQHLLDLIPIVLKLLNTMNMAQGGKGIFGGGIFQSFIGGLLGIGFQSGGYTGPGAASTPAGIVHAGEYVMSKAAVDRLGVGYLDALHNAAKGYQMGGYVRAQAPANVNMRGYQSGGYVKPVQTAQMPAPQVNVEQHFHIEGAVSSKDVQQMVRAGASEAVDTVKRSLTSWQHQIAHDGAVA